MSERPFGEELILAEARQREQASETAKRQRELVIIERESFTTADRFVVQDEHGEFPIDGPGTLDTLLLVADVDTFGIEIVVDGRHVVNDSFSNLQDDSPELERLSAYQRGSDDQFVFAAADYPFQQRLHARIHPSESTTFDRQRAEVDVVRE